MLNKVQIIGRLGRDPELKYTSTGMPIANLRIATDESYIGRDGNKVDRTEWHTVVLFQKTAENAVNYLAKGSLVFVEGSLQTRKWQDQQGQDRYSTEIKGHTIKFLDRKKDQQGDDSPQQSRNNGRQQGGNNQGQYGDLGPAFPSEASGMDDVPF